MRLLARNLLVFVLIASPFPSVSSQTPEHSSQQNEQKIRISSAEVLLDVVVKDKKGRPVTDLTAEDFEISEDGIGQSIESFKLVTRGPANRPAKADEGKPPAPSSGNPSAETKSVGAPKLTPVERRPDPEVGVNVVALVFDRLSPDSRRRAYDAAMSYVGENNELSGFAGVFAINLSLNIVQNYTTDIGLVKKGIEKAGALASASFNSGNSGDSGSLSTTQPGTTDNSAARDAIISAAQSGGAAAGSAAGAASVDQQFQVMQQRARETFEVLQRDQQGFATTNGLLAIVNSMRRLPGRKAIIFFSDGIAIPPSVQQHFRSVVNAANRANVSVYAVDAAGLRTESPLKETRDEINARARQRLDNSDKLMRTPEALTKGLERNEDLLNLNPQNGLLQLALETGGEFIGDTNKIGTKLKQIDEELSTYFLVTYSPKNQNYDGKFRNVAVKVKRSGVDLQFRRGYYAVPPLGNSPLFYYEAPALAVLNAPARQKDFPILVNSLNFPESERLGRTAVEVEAPATAFTFAPDHEKKVYTTDFSVVVLIKDQSKQIVDKLSHHYSLLGPLGSINAAKKGKILFYRETNLPPGKYDVEAVVFDALSNKASVNRCALEIPSVDENNLRMSSVVIIQRAEQVKEKSDSPFLIGEVLVYPNLGEPVSKSVNKQVGFYFTIYSATGSNGTPKLLLEVFQGGKSVAKVPLKLTPPDEKGRIQYASALPLDSLGPGTYELRVSVSDAKGTISRSTAFTLEP